MIPVFWNVTPYSLVGTYCLYIKGKNPSALKTEAVRAIEAVVKICHTTWPDVAED